MKETKKSKKEPDNESTLNRKLLKYSLVAGSAFAMAQPADAAIECYTTGPGEYIVYNGLDACVDLDGDTNFDVCFRAGTGTHATQSYLWYYVYSAVNLVALTSASVQRTSYDGFRLPVLAQGHQVGPDAGSGHSWADMGMANGVVYSGWNKTYKSYFGPYPGGNFFDNRGCIGVRFYSELDGMTHYGWIEYEGSGWSDNPVVGGRVLGWGYETEPNTSIPACTCEETPTTPIPSLNPLGLAILAGLLLAGGAVAVRRRRGE